jgi:hypothetical protein
VRRWVWVFIRVEWEIVRRTQDAVEYTEVPGESGVDTAAESFELVGDNKIDEPLTKNRQS